MRKLFVVVGLVAAACGGSPQGQAGSVPEMTTASTGSVDDAVAATTGAPEATETLDAGATQEPSVRQRPEGPSAPDFVLALGQGGEFSLSAEQKPVYMVFWAEW